MDKKDQINTFIYLSLAFVLFLIYWGNGDFSDIPKFNRAPVAFFGSIILGLIFAILPMLIIYPIISYMYSDENIRIGEEIEEKRKIEAQERNRIVSQRIMQQEDEQEKRRREQEVSRKIDKFFE